MMHASLFNPAVSNPSVRPASLRFGSNIYLVTHRMFQRLVTAQILPKGEQQARQPWPHYAKAPWRIEDRARLQSWGYTEGAYDCNIGGITNGKRVTLFHLFPPNAPLERIHTDLSADALELSREVKGEKPLHGLLAGGRDYDDSQCAAVPGDNQNWPDERPMLMPGGYCGRYKSSKRLYNTLLKVMRDAGEGRWFSQIWGRRSAEMNGPTDLLYDAAQDAWALRVGLNSGFDVLTRGMLKKTFSVVDIAPGDKLVTLRNAKTYWQGLRKWLQEGA